MKHVKLYEEFLNEGKKLPKEFSKHKDIPEWANYLAQHSDGEWTWYEETPTMIKFKSGGGAWKQDGNQTYTGVKTDGSDWDKIPTYYKVKNGKITESLNERAVSQEAYQIHLVTRSGQDAVQNFIDDNKIDGKKLLDYTLQNKGTAEELNIRDYIAGTGVGSRANLLKRFIKKFK